VLRQTSFMRGVLETLLPGGEEGNLGRERKREKRYFHFVPRGGKRREGQTELVKLH